MKYLLPFILLFLLMVAGCNTAGTASTDFTGTSLGKTPLEDINQACVDVLRQHFRRVSIDDETQTIQVAPQHYTDFVLGQAKSFRLNPKLTISPKNQRWWVYLQIRVERQDSQTYEMFHSQSAGEKPFSDPSLSRSTYAHKQVWTYIRRERTLEKEIIQQIREKLGLSVPTPPLTPQ